jgi:hypothetical protein
MSISIHVINDVKSNSTVAVGLSFYPDPGSSSVVVVKVAPKVPSSDFCFTPVPQRPGFSRGFIHKWHIDSSIECGKGRVFTEVSFA